VAAAKAGSMFGKYQLKRLLGQGGMGDGQASTEPVLEYSSS